MLNTGFRDNKTICSASIKILKMMRRIGYMGLLWLLLSAVVPAVGQVDYCYTFEDGYDNSRPMYWSALPNLDYHYVGVQSHTVHTGSKAMQINGCTCYAIMPDEGINYSANGV